MTLSDTDLILHLISLGTVLRTRRSRGMGGMSPKLRLLIFLGAIDEVYLAARWGCVIF